MRPSPLLPCLCAVFFLAPAPVGARDEPAGEPFGLEALLEPIRERHGVPALGGAVLTREGLVAVGAVGRRAADKEEKVTREDRWHLGSCTKAMTATLVARLVERGEVRFEDTLGASFRGLPVHERLREVTLERLLAHRGGMPAAYPPALWAWCWKAERDGRGQRERMSREMLAAEPAQEPGPYLYSNMGFDLVGAALERTKDTAFETLLAREVFEPLGIESAGFGAPGRAGQVSEPMGHRPGSPPSPVEPGPGADNPLVLAPAGRVHMRLSDWARFCQVHVGAEIRTGGKKAPFLQPETIARLHTPREGEEYVGGWIATRRGWAKGTVLTHAGSNTMWYAVAWLAPESGFGVLAVTNVAGEAGPKACDEVASALIRWHQSR
jgi:CubicO group peptidase (beta-lactamase class C family)